MTLDNFSDLSRDRMPVLAEALAPTDSNVFSTTRRRGLAALQAISR